MYSWNDHKPVVNKISDGSKSYTISRHTSQGSKSINLLGGLPNPPSIPPNHAQSFMIAAHQVLKAVEYTVLTVMILGESPSRHNYILV